jgi:nitrogen fixation/metabolism regulation signal transduction histidine kinase
MLNKVKIRTRLIAGFGVVVLFLILVGALSLKNLIAQGRLLTEFYNHPFTVTNAILRADAQIVRIHRAMKDVALYAGEREEEQAAERAMEKSENIVYHELAVARENFDGDKSKIDQIKASMDEWRPVRERASELRRANRTAEAVAYHKTFARQLVTKIDTQVDDVLKTASSQAQEFEKEAQRNTRWTVVVTALLVILAGLFAAVTAFAITASIVKPLNAAVEAADRLSEGDVSVEIGSDAPDELGQLLRAMGKMVQSLRRMGESANRSPWGTWRWRWRPSPSGMSSASPCRTWSPP